MAYLLAICGGIAGVKSQDMGDSSSSLLWAKDLEWRRDDESRASAVGGVAAEGAAARRGRSAAGRADLPAFRHLSADVLQVEKRFDAAEAAGLCDRPRAPQRSPRATHRRSSARSCICGRQYHFGAGRIADYLKRFHQVVDRAVLGASPPGEARHGPAAGQSEASAAQAALDSATKSRSPGIACSWT